MSIQVEQADITLPLEGRADAGRRVPSLSPLRYLPGLALVALAAVLYSRAGYGPFGDPAQRARPCTVSRCAHNATIVLAAGVAAIGTPRARDFRQERAG